MRELKNQTNSWSIHHKNCTLTHLSIVGRRRIEVAYFYLGIRDMYQEALFDNSYHNYNSNQLIVLNQDCFALLILEHYFTFILFRIQLNIFLKSYIQIIQEQEQPKLTIYMLIGSITESIMYCRIVLID
ncbi:hypothetical protein BpHYR1_003600 [Brachionus plicatilis]|uniref:Uncharacterized protein n=1 Tax=Brachionus plicatilis TaxID=10195 RepID=A0A3M7PAM9_BRAPC|nr:hypothetical protein BpHYR1_003600 [Brachionus plicatilis]